MTCELKRTNVAILNKGTIASTPEVEWIMAGEGARINEATARLLQTAFKTKECLLVSPTFSSMTKILYLRLIDQTNQTDYLFMIEE